VTPEAILGYWTGLALLAPDLPFATLWRTALLIHICDAVVCGILAHKGNRPRWRWTAYGCIGGIWALALVMLLPARPAAARN
jgi:hypothetical protein